MCKIKRKTGLIVILICLCLGYMRLDFENQKTIDRLKIGRQKKIDSVTDRTYSSSYSKHSKSMTSTSTSYNSIRQDNFVNSISSSYTINEKKFCQVKNGEANSVYLLIAIKSASKNFMRRQAIRSTWGNKTLYPDFKVKRLFLLARPERTGDQVKLDRESSEHRDIIQADFRDSFRNLTRKEVMFLKWVHDYCSEAKYIYKGDDDVYVNVKTILNYLQKISTNAMKSLFVGSIMAGSPRVTDPQSRYYVPDEMYPKKIYPPYVSGGSFVMSSQVANKLFNVSKYIPLIPIDDAFLGICLEKIGLRPQNHAGFKNYGFKNSSDICAYDQVMTVHGIFGQRLINIWPKIQNIHKVNCTMRPLKEI